MKLKTSIAGILLLLSGLGLAFAGPVQKTIVVKQNAVPQEIDKDKDLKEILFKLVRQDEHLDEVMEKLEAGKPLAAYDLSALGLSLKMIANNVSHISGLSKKEFAEIEAGGASANYTNAIFSYGSKLNRKAGRVAALTAGLAARNKKAGMRDAVSSKKGKKIKGKKLTQLLAEQAAADALAADAKSLRGASGTLAATSKWLYIASK